MTDYPFMYYSPAPPPMFDPNAILQSAISLSTPSDSVRAMLDLAEQVLELYPGERAFQIEFFEKLLPYVIEKLYATPHQRRTPLIARIRLIAEQFGYSNEQLRAASKVHPKALTPQPAKTQAAPTQLPPTYSEPSNLRPSAEPSAWNVSTPINPNPPSVGLAQTNATVSSSQDDTTDLGNSIAQVFTDYGHPGVHYLPEELGENSRFNLLSFSWQSGDIPEKIKKRRSELTLVGLNPDDIRIVITQGVKKAGKIEGRFEVQVPKDEWSECLLLVWLYEKYRGPAHLSDRVQRFDWLVKNIPKAQPYEPLVTRFGLDLRNKPIEINHRKGVFSVGSPDSGKSSCLVSRTGEALLTHTPATLEIYAIDLKKVTFERFEDLIYVITDANRVTDFLIAVRSEGADRNQTFADAGVKDILDYNLKFPQSPLPIIWIIIDEIFKVRQEVNDPDLIKRIEELSGFTRSVGIYWDIATQYPSREYAVTPATRNNLGEKILFSCDENAANLVLSSSNAEDLASSLLGEGDALVKAHQRKKQVTRGQSFYIPDRPDKNWLAELVHVLKLNRPPLKPSKLLEQTASPTGTVSSNTIEKSWMSSTSPETLIQAERNRAKWNLIQEFDRYNAANPQSQIPKRRLYAAVYGDILCQIDIPVETIQDLLATRTLDKTDPRVRVYENGGNEATAQKHIEQLRQRFGETANALV